MWILIIGTGALVVFFLIRRPPDAHEYLSVLSESDWVSGVDVIKKLKAARGISVSLSTMYAAMRRLKDEELIESRHTSEQDGDSRFKYPRREFRLTNAGARCVTHPKEKML
jgi:DNA-binding PadR family transcriptional regulator